MGQTDLSKFDNSWYKPGCILKRLLWYGVNACFFISPLCACSSFKVFLLRLFGANIGKGVIIKPGVNIKYPWFLTVGDYAWIGERVWIDNLGKVSIGANACISQGALILSGNHNYKKNTFDLIVKDIIIEEGAWVGANAIVCQGVTCKSHSILTVGSVATGDLEPYYVYQGNPAVKIRERTID